MRGILLAALAASVGLSQSPETARKLQEARELAAAGKPEQAAAIYAELARQYPDQPSFLVNLAVSQFKAGRYRDAIEAAERALQLQPDLWTASLFLGASHLELGQPRQAVRPLEQALRAQPGDRNARRMLEQANLAITAERFEQGGRYADAAGQWQQALALAPGNARLQTKLAWAFYRARNYDASRHLLEELRARPSQSVELDFLYGGCLLNLGQPRKAIPFFESALRRDAKLTPAHAGLGQALLETGQPKEAIPHLEAARSIDQDGSIHYQLARAYRLTGRPDLARQMLDRSAALRKQ